MAMKIPKPVEEAFEELCAAQERVVTLKRGSTYDEEIRRAEAARDLARSKFDKALARWGDTDV